MYDITNPPAKLQLSHKTRNLERRTAPLHRTKIKTPPPAGPWTSTLHSAPTSKAKAPLCRRSCPGLCVLWALEMPHFAWTYFSDTLYVMRNRHRNTEVTPTRETTGPTCPPTRYPKSSCPRERIPSTFTQRAHEPLHEKPQRP
jgi:hypothetical protein